MLEKLRHGYQLPGASGEEINACETTLGIKLPDDYKFFLGVSNGFNDEVGAGYLILWSVGEFTSLNQHELFALQADRFLIGSNGGPTAYGIIGSHYISIPFVFAGPWENEVRVLGQSFDHFISAIEAGLGW